MQASAVTRKDRERQMRQQEILQAARDLFLEQGYHETTLEEIARRAEFGKGTIYNYFSSKEELFFALIDQLIDRFHSMAHAAMNHEGENVRQLYTRYAYDIISHARNNTVLIQFIMREKHQLNLDNREDRKPCFKNRIRSVWHLLAKPLQKEQQAGRIKQIDPLFLAMMFDGMLRTFCMTHFGPMPVSSPVDTDQVVKVLITLFFEGISEQND